MGANIVIVNPEDDNIESIITFLESEYDFNIVKIKDISSLEQKLNDGSPDLIIIDAGNFDKDFETCLKKIKNTDNSLPAIVIKPFSKDHEFECSLSNHTAFYFLDRPLQFNELTEAIDTLLGPEHSHTEDEEYCRLPIRRFFDIDIHKNDFEVYIRLSKRKFVKIINRDTDAQMAHETIDKYIKKEVPFLYLSKFDYGIVVMDVLEEDRKKLVNPHISEKKRLEIHAEVIEDIHDTIQQFDISKQTIELAEASIQTTTNVIRKNKQVGNLLDQLIKNKNFIHDLAMLTNYIGCATAMNIDWNSKLSLDKIAFAALLQDISLKDPELAKVTTTHDPLFSTLSGEQKQMILDHPEKSSRLVDTIPEVPSDAKNIILQHHERPDGTGFHKGLNKDNIMPLAAVFILAHEFSVRYLLKKESMEDIKARMELHFGKGNFRKPLKAFLKIL